MERFAKMVLLSRFSRFYLMLHLRCFTEFRIPNQSKYKNAITKGFHDSSCADCNFTK